MAKITETGYRILKFLSKKPDGDDKDSIRVCLKLGGSTAAAIDKLQGDKLIDKPENKLWLFQVTEAGTNSIAAYEAALKDKPSAKAPTADGVSMVKTGRSKPRISPS